MSSECRIPAVSFKTTGNPPIFIAVSITSRVVPAIGVTMAAERWPCHNNKKNKKHSEASFHPKWLLDKSQRLDKKVDQYDNNKRYCVATAA